MPTWDLTWFNVPLPMLELVGCASNPCQNGATCFTQNGGSGYVCLCPAGFEGTNCENGIVIVCHISIRYLNVFMDMYVFIHFKYSIVPSYVIFTWFVMK